MNTELLLIAAVVLCIVLGIVVVALVALLLRSKKDARPDLNPSIASEAQASVVSERSESKPNDVNPSQLRRRSSVRKGADPSPMVSTEPGPAASNQASLFDEHRRSPKSDGGDNTQEQVHSVS